MSLGKLSMTFNYTRSMRFTIFRDVRLSSNPNLRNSESRE